MKLRFKTYKRNQKAVSAVIGVILMVAITIAVATTVYFYISGVIGETSPKSSTLALSVYSRDDSLNVTIWLVSGFSGETIPDDSYEAILLYNNGTADTGANITKQEVMGAGFVNSGDTFTVIASEDGNFVFLITDKHTGSTMFKSIPTRY